MIGRLASLENYPKNELYYHDVVVPDFFRGVVKQLEKGIPLFTLAGRATLSRGKSAMGKHFERYGKNIVFLIPETKRDMLIKPIHKSPYELDDAAHFPDWFTFTMCCSPEFRDAAMAWIREQKKINYYWKDFEGVNIEDVRMLPISYLLGLY